MVIVGQKGSNTSVSGHGASGKESLEGKEEEMSEEMEEEGEGEEKIFVEEK